MAALPSVPPQELGKKDREMFQQLLSCYEKKDYHRGVKLADTILKKHSNNGETQAMKGLLKNCLGHKEEAHELCKTGLRNNMKSHVCWHVYGLVHRSENNYKEASKCYLNALRWFKDNQNILRDLSWLQIHVSLVIDSCGLWVPPSSLPSPRLGSAHPPLFVPPPYRASS